MPLYVFDLSEVDAQIDHHLSKVPKKRIPPYFDFDDFRQNIYLALLSRAGTYDPRLCTKKTFQDRIIRLCVMRFILGLRWKKNRSCGSLSGGETISDPVINDVMPGELQIAEQAVFAGEVQAAINRMDDDLQEICELLQHYSLTETAAILGVRPNKIHRAMKRIRENMTEAGIEPGNFLEKE